jgi:hypothetical protein
MSAWAQLTSGGRAAAPPRPAQSAAHLRPVSEWKADVAAERDALLGSLRATLRAAAADVGNANAAGSPPSAAASSHKVTFNVPTTADSNDPATPEDLERLQEALAAAQAQVAAEEAALEAQAALAGALMTLAERGVGGDTTAPPLAAASTRGRRDAAATGTAPSSDRALLPRESIRAAARRRTSASAPWRRGGAQQQTQARARGGGGGAPAGRGAALLRELLDATVGGSATGGAAPSQQLQQQEAAEAAAAPASPPPLRYKPTEGLVAAYGVLDGVSRRAPPPPRRRRRRCSRQPCHWQLAPPAVLLQAAQPTARCPT